MTYEQDLKRVSRIEDFEQTLRQAKECCPAGSDLRHWFVDVLDSIELLKDEGELNNK
jgi:hypothetical protein